MLAYVFWHWRRPDVAAGAYETAQRAFHQALASAPPAGFARSLSAAIREARWANDGMDAYEDWYVVDRTASLDPLNDGAVTASRSAPHDAAAAVAAGGTAGLWTLRAGEILDRPAVAYWFAKPRGMSYAALDAAVGPLTLPGQGTLWMRRMVLGPAPELCLHSATPVTLPWPAQAIPWRTIWPA